MSKPWGIIAVVGLAASLTACGGGSDATWSGTAVADPAKALKTIDDAWKTHVANADVKVRTIDDSRCYFETSESDGKKVLGDKVLCGPYRELGSEKTAWDVAPLGAQGSDGDTVLVGLTRQDADSSPFTQGEGSPNLVPWRPDGKKADLTKAVDEPDAPKLNVGDVVQDAKIPEGAKATDGQEIITPTGRYTTRFVTVDRVGSGNDRKAAPDGGTILVVEAAPGEQESTGFGTSERATGSTTFSVRAGGKDYPMTLGTGSTSTAVAVSGDGKDATYAYTYDGLTQSLDATGKRVGSKAAGFYLPVTQGTSPDIKVQLGTADTNLPGWHGSATLSNLSLALSAYDSSRKWAPDGKVWAHVQARWSEDGPTFTTPDSGTGYYSTTPTMKSVTLGGVKATASTFSEQGGVDATFLLPADADARALKLKAVVVSAGPMESFSATGAPGAASSTYTFDGTLTLQK